MAKKAHNKIKAGLEQALVHAKCEHEWTTDHHIINSLVNVKDARFCLRCHCAQFIPVKRPKRRT